MFILIKAPAILVCFVFLFAENDWKLSLEKDQILVYTREVESSSFNEFLAQATMNGTIDDFKKIITDIDNYFDWVPDCKTIEIIDRPTPNDITYYMKLKVPFPFANRDIVQRILLEETEDDRLEVIIKNIPDKVKREKKYIRMQKAHGKWTITKLSENRISVSFQYFADPGGEIPAWLVNSFIVKNPHLSLSNMRKLMAENK